KAALVALNEVRPRSLSFATLWERIRASLGQASGGIADRDDGPRLLASSLLRCFFAELVDLHVKPPRFASGPGEWPIASPLARLQAEGGSRVTSLRRRRVELNGLDRVVLGQLDGTRDRCSVLETVRRLIAADELTMHEGDQPIRDPARIDEILAAELEPSLCRLADLALLVA